MDTVYLVIATQLVPGHFNAIRKENASAKKESVAINVTVVKKTITTLEIMAVNLATATSMDLTIIRRLVIQKVAFVRAKRMLRDDTVVSANQAFSILTSIINLDALHASVTVILLSVKAQLGTLSSRQFQISTRTKKNGLQWIQGTNLLSQSTTRLVRASEF